MTAGKSTVNRNLAPGSFKSQNLFVQYIKRTKCTYRIGNLIGCSFFSFPSQKFSLFHYFTPKRALFHYFNRRRISVTNGHLFTTAFFFLRAVHDTFTLVSISRSTTARGSATVFHYSIPKETKSENISLIPMVLFLFNPRELIKRPSFGRLN